MSDDAYEAYLERRRQETAAYEERNEQLKDAEARILAGLDQVRAQLGAADAITYRRLKELAERIAYSQYDFTVADAVLVGTWMLASAQSQTPEPGPEDLPTPGDFA